MYTRLRGTSIGASKYQAVLQSLTNKLNATGQSGFVDAKTSRLGFGLESADATPAMLSEAQDIISEAAAGLESIFAGADGASATGRMAATMALGLTGDIGTYLRSSAALENAAVEAGAIPAGDSVARIQAALESYDEKENKKASQYTLTYNLYAARQDDFGEALFPTVIVPPDEVGFHMALDLVNVHSEIRRGTDAAPEDWQPKNLVFAWRNPEILDSDSTSLIPVWREAGTGIPGNEKAMVSKAIITPRNVTPYNETFATQPLAIDAKFSLLKICQTDGQLEAGHNDSSDAIDTDIKLSALYVKFGDDVIRVSTEVFAGHQFNHSVQNDRQRMSLDMMTDSVLIKATTKTYINGVQVGDLADLAAIKTNDLEVRLEMGVTGYVIRDYGTTEVNPRPIRVASIRTATNELVALDDPSVATLVATLEAGKIIGYDLKARRVNTNRRTLGKLLQTRQITQLYAVPLMTTLAIQRPQSVSDATDASDIGYLIAGTRAACSGAAVRKLIEFSQQLPEIVSMRSSYDENTNVLGPAARLLKPFHRKIKIEVDKNINLTDSYTFGKNLQSVLVNAIRDHLFNGWRDSNLKSAYSMINGGDDVMPQVLFATDQVLSRYLMIDGDLRTIGGGFDKYRVVESQAEMMDGKMFITLVPPNMPEGVPHPFSFGWMAWKPEVAVVLPIHRNGANNKELIVQPSYNHVVNLPWLIEVEVTGIPDAANARTAFKIEGEITTTP